MRPQQKEIVNSFWPTDLKSFLAVEKAEERISVLLETANAASPSAPGPGFNLNIAFLTTGDLLSCASKVLEIFSGNPKASRNTFEGWLRSGVIAESNKHRSIRNRLYSGLDLLRTSLLFYATQVGIPAPFGATIANRAIEMFAAQGRFTITHWEDLDSVRFEPRNFLIACQKEGVWELAHIEESADFNKFLSLSGMVILVNFDFIFRIALDVFHERYWEIFRQSIRVVDPAGWADAVAEADESSTAKDQVRMWGLRRKERASQRKQQEQTEKEP